MTTPNEAAAALIANPDFDPTAPVDLHPHFIVPPTEPAPAAPPTEDLSQVPFPGETAEAAVVVREAEGEPYARFLEKIADEQMLTATKLNRSEPAALASELRQIAQRIRSGEAKPATPSVE